MKTALLLPLLAAASALAVPNPALDERANRCKRFQIMKSPNKSDDGTGVYVGTPQCCCANAQCHVYDQVNDINTSAHLNNFLSGDFTIKDARTADKGKPGSNDIRGSTYTVGAQGPC